MGIRLPLEEETRQQWQREHGIQTLAPLRFAFWEKGTVLSASLIDEIL
jgi:hypothetical protein